MENKTINPVWVVLLTTNELEVTSAVFKTRQDAMKFAESICKAEPKKYYDIRITEKNINVRTY